MADSYNMFRVLDALWTINQTPLERSVSLGRGWIAKSRDGNSKVDFKIYYDYNTQLLMEIPQTMYASRMAGVKLVIDKVEKKKRRESETILDI